MTLSVSALSTPLIAGDVEFNQNLSPDAMMIYLQTRLDGIDAQVDSIFNDQKRQQQVQSVLNRVKSIVGELNANATEPTAFPPGRTSTMPAFTSEMANMTSEQMAELQAKYPDKVSMTVQQRVDQQLAILATIDPTLAAKVRSDLSSSNQLFAPGSDAPGATYDSTKVKAAQAVLESVGKDLESTAQMNMIRLQSVMSARQTAIQLATNLVSSLGESTKAIVSNLGH